MFVVIGATGRVGHATAAALREAGAPVRVIVRDQAKAGRLEAIGCEAKVGDIHDVSAMIEAMSAATAVQVVAPLAPQAEDPVAELRRSMHHLVEALAQARPKAILAISDYGAHVAHDIGIPSVFREFEQRLMELEGRRLIVRSAEHMHNWARVIPGALASGVLPSFHDPVDAVFPTIAAPDLGAISAELLLRPPAREALEVVHAEGPQRYSADDVAAALGRLSGRAVQAHAVPREQWQELLARGAPMSLVELLIETNDAQNQGGLIDVEPGSRDLRRGSTELIEALRPLLSAA